jgi:hypothetical protein
MKSKSSSPLAPTNPRLRSIKVEPLGEARSFVTGAQRVTLVPLSIRRKHNRKLMIPPPGANCALSTGHHDLPMIRTLGKAFYWQKLLDDGRFESIAEMAKYFDLEAGWMAEVIRMTTLAPDIIEAVLEGRQPRQLDLQRLRGRTSQLPREWSAQRKVFGFAS